MASHVSKVISHTVEELIKEPDGFARAARIQSSSGKTNIPIIQIIFPQDH